MADGVWHVLSWLSSGQNTFLLLDTKSILNITGRGTDLTPVRVEKIIFGAALTGDSNLQQLGKYTQTCLIEQHIPTLTTYNTDGVKADPKRWGALRMMLAGYGKERSSEERPKKSFGTSRCGFPKQAVVDEQ